MWKKKGKISLVLGVTKKIPGVVDANIIDNKLSVFMASKHFPHKKEESVSILLCYTEFRAVCSLYLRKVV